MRLFISINLPDRLNDYLRELQGRLNKAVSGNDCVSLQHAGQKSGFHITLFFLGEVAEGKAKRIATALKEGLEDGGGVFKTEPFKLKFSEKLDCFQHHGIVKSVFLGIDEGHDGYGNLLELQKKVVEIVGKFGFKDESAFTPHVTLSRVRGCGENFADDILACEVALDEMEVDGVALMESHEGGDYKEAFSV